MTNVLVVASTFPAHSHDSVAPFVRDQVVAMKKTDNSIDFSVLAPHDPRSLSVDFTRHKHYDEYRFHYFFLHKYEKLAGRGMMPAVKANPLYYALIPLLFICELIALWRLTVKLKPDIIYAHWFTPQAINACVVGWLTKTDYVFTTHAADVDIWHKIPFVGRWIVRATAPKAKAITAVSTRSMAKLSSFFSETAWKNISRKTKIIPMGVNLPRIDDAMRKASSNYILFVGRLAEKKGVQYLLPAYAKIKDRIPASDLVIAGDGPMLEQLKLQANELGLGDRVKFPGFVTGSSKHDLIKSARVYVVPSIVTDSGDAEGMPVSLMEGLAYGKVCIATNESGADDIITHGKDGYLLPQKDVEQLAKLLVDAVLLDGYEYDKISAAATNTAQQFSWSLIARQHIEFLFKQGVDRV